MGLDIYFYRVSSKEKAEEFLAASKQYEIAYDAYTEKYKEPIEKAEKKWRDWYNAENIKYEEHAAKNEEYEFDHSNEPSYDMKDFMTPIDRTGWEFVENTYKDLKNEINFTYEGQYKDLYMRKQNWMLQYVYNRFPERLVKLPDYSNKILDDCKAILTLDDVNDLIDRMEKVLAAGEFKTYQEATGKPEADEKGWYFKEAIDYHNEWTPTEAQNAAANEYLPTRSGFFFGSVTYDYFYFQRVRDYLESFKKWRDEVRMPGEVLLYEESW